MQKKLTVTIDEEVCEGLRKTIGPRKISGFIEELVRTHVGRPDLEAAYAEMARDKRREKEAVEWAEITYQSSATTHRTSSSIEFRLFPSPARQNAAIPAKRS